MDWPWLQDQIAQHWRQELTAIHDAPIAFLILMVVCAVGWRLFLGHRFVSHDIRAEAQQSLIDRLQSDVAEYKDRLNGASPKEAQEKIQALEGRLARLEYKQPERVISAERLAAMKAAVAAIAEKEQWILHGQVYLIHETSDGEAARFSKRLIRAMEDAGMRVAEGLGAVAEEDEYGIVLRVNDPEDIWSPASIVVDFFNRSGLEYTLRKAPYNSNPPLQIMVARQKPRDSTA